MNPHPVPRKPRGSWFTIGAGIGAAIGSATGAIAEWLALGVAIGFVLDAPWTRPGGPRCRVRRPVP
ncbi:MAG: hypothetical protein EOP90_04435 [Lysobacteraceae bacterium]|nr:MAG: hypothetical protein EOP90_04435 [Xanthomonadaceae bacterium]